MYLKSIEVQGFKSFANKIVFQFDTGIIKQFVYVLQPAGTSVDQIFTFSGTVNTPCHRNLIKINRQLMITVVKGYGYMGRARSTRS